MGFLYENQVVASWGCSPEGLFEEAYQAAVVTIDKKLKK